MSNRFADWIAGYETAWRTEGTAPLGRLLTEDATYQAAPFDEQLAGVAAIGRFWEDEREGPERAIRGRTLYCRCVSTACTVACPGCGGPFPNVDGPVHAYVPSSRGCWQTFGEVQADEMQRFRYPPAHGLVVDAYMAQHPGDGTDRRDRQSVFVHLIGLCARLEDELPQDLVRDLFRRMLQQRRDFPVLRRSRGPGRLTVLHMVDAKDLTDYEQRARAWGEAVWRSWCSEHERIRRALRTATERGSEQRRC